MPERGFDTGFWGDPFVMKLPQEAKTLFAYSWTNPHCNPAGLYEIALETISFETGIPETKLPGLFELLEPKVVWYPEVNLLWVKNFLKRQSKSPKFLAAAAKSLLSINNNGAVRQMLQYNFDRYSISIPYQYYMDRVSILTRASASASVSDSDKGVGVVKGKGDLAGDEKGIISSLGQLRGWQADEDDVLWLHGLRSECPGFTPAEFRACVDFYSGKPIPKHKGIWKNRFRNWMIKKQEFERRDKHEQPRKGVRPKPEQKRIHPIKRLSGDEEAEG